MEVEHKGLLHDSILLHYELSCEFCAVRNGTPYAESTSFRVSVAQYQGLNHLSDFHKIQYTNFREIQYTNFREIQYINFRKIHVYQFS
jgi:hypothetical protein